jgi:hypothetical protein
MDVSHAGTIQELVSLMLHERRITVGRNAIYEESPNMLHEQEKGETQERLTFVCPS